MVDVHQQSPERALVQQLQEIDRRDDEQIIAAMTGEIITEYVYSFKDGAGRLQTGLSWAGTREMAQHRGNIGVEEAPIVEEREDHYRIMARATDYLRNVTLWGGCHQPKRMKIYERDNEGNILVDENGERKFYYEDDPFAEAKGIAKAQRNAIKNIMPVTVVKAMITRFLELQKKGKTPEAPAKKAPSTTRIPASEEKERLQLRGQLVDLLTKQKGMGVGDAIAWITEEFNVRSTSQLTLDQLKQAVEKASALPAKELL